uniref:Uncharacterized protein n=1 Tax=Magallana gigas TaxID=29159 RepID=A0A8W8IFN7_MAGGI
MACCGYASGWAKLSLGCLALASLFQVVAWSTPSWMIGASGGTTTRVGLWKTRICTSVCVESSVDISYKNDAFRTTQAMETIAFILLLLMPILAGVYVMSALASSLVLIAAMTLIPDIKEYDYESKSTVYPDHTGKYTRLEKSESVRNVSGGPGLPRRPSDIMLTTIGDDTSGYKRSRDLGREYGRPKRQESVGSSRDFNPYPYGPPSSKDAFNREQDRFDLEVITPSAPPRYDFMQRKF